MTIETLQNSRVFQPNPDCFYQQRYPNGQPFRRLTLTLSKKGWSASIQWEGTCGLRGDGPTQEAAIQNAIDGIEKAWGNKVIF